MKVQQHVRPWIILFAYLGIALLMTLPLGLRFGTHLPDGMDTLVHYWNDWWVGYALRNGQPLYHTSHMFYPQGITLVYHNISWVHIFPWLALEPLIGGIAAYNAIFVLYLALCGCAFFALACEFTGDRRVAFVAGLIYQCWPHRLTHPSHPNYMSTWPIPLFVLFLLRAIRHRHRRSATAGGPHRPDRAPQCAVPRSSIARGCPPHRSALWRCTAVGRLPFDPGGRGADGDPPLAVGHPHGHGL